MEDYGIIDNAFLLVEKLMKVDSALIQFIKKDQSVRLMRCTLNFNIIPKDHKPKTVNLPAIYKYIRDKKLIRVYDLEKMGWRSVDLKTVEWIEMKDDKKNVIKYRLRITK